MTIKRNIRITVKGTFPMKKGDVLFIDVPSRGKRRERVTVDKFLYTDDVDGKSHFSATGITHIGGRS